MPAQTSPNNLNPTLPALDDCYELLYELDDMRSLIAAEAGSGAMSLGYGTDGAYAAAAEAGSRFTPDAEERAARVLVALVDAGYRYRAPAPAPTTAHDDIPF